MWGTKVQNMKFLCLNLWLGEVCTDKDANDDNNDDANNDDDTRRTKHDCIRPFGRQTK